MWAGATYYDQSWPEPGRRNTVDVPTFTGRVVRMDSESKLREIYGLRSARTPMLVNSVCHASIVEEVKRKAGRFFVGYSPDFAAGVAMLAHARSFVFVDTILSVGGATRVSTGMMVRQTRGEVFEQTMRDLGDFADLRRVPLRIDVQTAHLANHFLLLKDTFPEELRPYEIDWVQFFVNCRRELDIYARNGYDVSTEREAWRVALETEPASVRAAVEGRMARVAEDGASRKPAFALGPLGIDNIVDCARYLETSQRTAKGIIKGTLLSIFGGQRGTDVARALGSLVARARDRIG
jgi:hypothetical protein